MAFGISLQKKPALMAEYLISFPGGHINRARRRGSAANHKATIKPTRNEAKEKRRRKIADKSRKRNRRQ
jgi:hypothetical protein